MPRPKTYKTMSLREDVIEKMKAYLADEPRQMSMSDFIDKLLEKSKK